VGCPALSRLSSFQPALERDSRVYSNGKNTVLFTYACKRIEQVQFIAAFMSLKATLYSKAHYL